MQEKTVLVGVHWRKAGAANPAPDDFLGELRTLAASAGAQVVSEMLQYRQQPDAAYLLGEGKAEELRAVVAELAAELVIFDQELTPTQLRNLERKVGCRVIDRTHLILDIFASRAKTREGKLQVELAQLQYIAPRLTGRGVEMSRLGGGIGTRGPGETKLETDRRRIQDKIRKIKQDLEGVRATRGIQRRHRKSVPLATVALVGYTNAGKSTLFNRLTEAGVLADARMFATLDPTTRAVALPSRRRVLLSDTVGFIRQLPTQLVKAFRATLEEVAEADLLLHIVDGSSPEALDYIAHVETVLQEIGAAETPSILVWNKSDLGAGPIPQGAVPASGATGEGMVELLRQIDSQLQLDPVAPAEFSIPAGDGAALHLLHQTCEIVSKQLEETDWVITCNAPESARRRLASYLRAERT